MTHKSALYCDSFQLAYSTWIHCFAASLFKSVPINSSHITKVRFYFKPTVN